MPSASSPVQRRRLFVQGIVQGVGFRPWVYQLAHAHGLYGYVLNSTLGVTIEIEGPEESQLRFLEDFRHHPPPLAALDEIREDILDHAGYSTFEIRASQEAAGEFVLVPPDIATCQDCWADFNDPSNRRYGYPFTNCTNCGPRYTIIQDIPYDRPFTTMAEFRMCAACEAEYHDPSNRRFHAEPNACPACGPWVELRDRHNRLASHADAIAQAQRLLESGHILAIKGLGGFHLACLATSEDSVRRLRERKRRSDKPFAIMARDLKCVERLAELTDADRAALTSVRRPIVLVDVGQAPRPARGALAPQVAPGLSQIGVMLPYTPLHHLLFKGASYDTLVMTSGNLSEEPIASHNEEVAPRLHALADYFLIHNRKIQTRVDDSVVRTFEGRERTLRRSRGFAPHPVDLGVPVAQILACGGELKNVFCLTKEHYAVLSQHIGDLENLETLNVFEETLAHMKRFFRIQPVAVAHDLHPQYLSTRFALSVEGIEKIGVQHHHAHIAACMAEHRLDGSVIGVALDGTGYGTDGQIWGGEFLVCDYAAFQRKFHFRYIPLAGGDTAVRQVWRAGLAYLRDAEVDSSFLAEQVSQKAWTVVERMIEQRINTVNTSSCGRLFDAVASILGIRMEANYEGQAAMQLEAAADDSSGIYPFDLTETSSQYVQVDFRETIRALVRERSLPAQASAKFHSTVAAAILEISKRIRASGGLNRVCLSGGTFQNFRLLRCTLDLLRKADFEVFIHARVPPNDGGLCLGQAVIANRLLRMTKE